MPTNHPDLEPPHFSEEDLCALERIYAELEEELAALSPHCAACGRCCDFGSYGHELWLSDLELVALVGAHGHATPSATPHCPYMKDGRCAARAFRALACRTYYCELPQTAVEELTMKYVNKIESLWAEKGVSLSHGELLESLRGWNERTSAMRRRGTNHGSEPADE